MSLSMCNNYIVYKHTSPSGKVYIGITKFDPKYRWLNNGRGYRNQTIFFNAIIKYGWINFKHEILYTELSEEKALDKEEELIRKYKSYDRRFGYNVSLRGCLIPTNTTNSTRSNSRRKEILPIPTWKNRGKIIHKFNTATDSIVRTYRSVHELAVELDVPIETLRTRLNKYGILEYPEYYYKYANNQTPKVDMLSLNGEYIRIFSSLNDAYKYINRVNKGGITSVCTGNRDSYVGYKWRFRYEN